MKPEFYLQDDRSKKFWRVEVVGAELVTENGRIGAKPRETRTRFGSAELARKAAEKEIHGKRKNRRCLWRETPRICRLTRVRQTG